MAAVRGPGADRRALADEPPVRPVAPRPGRRGPGRHAGPAAVAAVRGGRRRRRPVLLAEPGAVRLAAAGARHRSVDPARPLSDGGRRGAGPRPGAAGAARALDLGTLACAAQLLGAGRALLEASVPARQARGRSSAGRSARSRRSSTSSPTWRSGSSSPGRCSTRRRVLALGAMAAADAPGTSPRRRSPAPTPPSRAARAALQVHGAIGYTPEHDLSLWLAKVRALVPAWGSQAEHRALVVAAMHQRRAQADGAGPGPRPRAAGPARRGPRPARRTAAPRAGDGAGAVAAAVRRDRRRGARDAAALRRRRGRPGRDPHRDGGAGPRPDVLAPARFGRSHRPGRAGFGGCRGLRAPAAGDRRRQRGRRPGVDGQAGRWDPGEAACDARPSQSARLAQSARTTPPAQARPPGLAGSWTARRTTCSTATWPMCC